MRRWILCLLVGLYFVPAMAGAVEETTPEERSLFLVKMYRFDKTLRPISYRLASNTQTFRMMVDEVGAEKAERMMRSELNKVIPQYQEQWNQNLAAAYAEVLSEEEVRSLTYDGAQSQHVGVLKQGLLSEMVTQAMTAAYRRLPANAAQSL